MHRFWMELVVALDFLFLGKVGPRVLGIPLIGCVQGGRAP